MKQTAFSLLVIALLVMPSVSKATEEGLLLYFPFEEGAGDMAVDDSGNDNDGTVQGDAEWVDSVKESFGKAFQLNGSNVEVRAPHIPLNEQNFTVMMWINPILYTDQQIIFSQSQAGSTNQSLHFRLGGPGIGAGNVPEGGVRMGFYSNDLDTSGGIIEDNTWYHLTFWYDFDEEIRRIYVNGKQEAEDTGQSPYLGTSGDTVIGSWDVDKQWFKGIIDDVRIYNRPVTESEIENAMEGPVGFAVHLEGKLATAWGTIKQAR